MILASLLSAFFVMEGFWGVLFGGPSSALSFPFYAVSPISDSRPYQVYFLTFVIYPIALHSSLISPFYFALLVFFLSNSLGAAIGYLLNVKHIVPQSYNWKGLLLLLTLGVATIFIGVRLFDLSPVWFGQPSGFIYPYRDDAWRLWTFGVTWIILVLGDFTLYLRTGQSPRRAHQTNVTS